ncbi:MAG TPA: IS1595 family transposase [Candidatus Kapabacteria bacterium]|nr:IS1595 family transposase [Candidatus Kapabacteria bacterium]
MTYSEFQKRFNTENDVVSYYISMRYDNDEVHCSHCGSVQVSQYRDRPRFFQCNACNNSFSIFSGTIFQKTTTDLRKWFYAIHLFLNGKKGISGLQLQREIGGSYKTSWRMLKQIRTAMGNNKKSDKKLFESIIEVDETYVGGKPRKGNTRTKSSEKKAGERPNKNKRGRGSKKTPVVGLVDRETKQVTARVALPNAEGKKLTGKQLMEIIDETTSKDATIISDEFKSYGILKSQNSTREHIVIVHAQEFARGTVHTNNIESFWATLKRGMYGIYHQVSKKYLQQYVNEFCFRHNYRKEDIFAVLIKRTVLE